MVRTSNICEIEVASSLEDQGYEVLKNGWPDFVAINWKTKEVRFIEVKPLSKKLKPRQLKMKKVFNLLGLNYETLFVWYGKIYTEKEKYKI